MVYSYSNSEGPDKMPHKVAFNQGMHYLLRQNQSSEKEIQYILETITCDPSIYILKDFRNAPPAKMLIYCQNVIF